MPMDKAPMAVILAGLKKKKPEMDMPMEMEDEEGMDEEGKLAAAEELIAALDAKDPKAVVEAFTALYDMC